MEDDERTPRRKRRTFEHVLEDLSENFLERKVLERGHQLRRPRRDYGVDVTMFHYADSGEIENGEVRFQLKSGKSLNRIKDGKFISHPISTGDLHYWSLEFYPFILVLYEQATNCGYWLHIQPYVSQIPDCLDPDQKTINVHVPVANELTVRSIDEFRHMSMKIVDKLRNQGGFPDVKRKPK